MQNKKKAEPMLARTLKRIDFDDCSGEQKTPEFPCVIFPIRFEPETPQQKANETLKRVDRRARQIMSALKSRWPFRKTAIFNFCRGPGPVLTEQTQNNAQQNKERKKNMEPTTINLEDFRAACKEPDGVQNLKIGGDIVKGLFFTFNDRRDKFRLDFASLPKRGAIGAGLLQVQPATTHNRLLELTAPVKTVFDCATRLGTMHEDEILDVCETAGCCWHVIRLVLDLGLHYRAYKCATGECLARGKTHKDAKEERCADLFYGYTAEIERRTGQRLEYWPGLATMDYRDPNRHDPKRNEPRKIESHNREVKQTLRKEMEADYAAAVEALRLFCRNLKKEGAPCC